MNIGSYWDNYILVYQGTDQSNYYPVMGNTVSIIARKTTYNKLPELTDVQMVQVIDDGKGMSEIDARLAFERHATSKIKSAEDLFSLTTMGFRGEALSSIAAVAQVEVITKTKDSVTGVRDAIEGAVEKEFEEVGAPDGTSYQASRR